jgi:hypothetical protein
MSAVFNFCEDNGAATGSPAVGTTRSQISNAPTDCSWKSVDDARTGSGGTLYSASPIVAGTNSYTKYQYGQFSGTYDLISSVLWSARTAPSGALATGIVLKGAVTSTYATPSQTANSALTIDYTSAPVAVDSGASVLLGADPSTAASSTLASGGGFTQYLATQLQVSTSASPGDMSTITMVLRYQES